MPNCVLTLRPRLVDRVDEFGGHYKVGQLGIIRGPRVVVPLSLPGAVVAGVGEVGSLIGTVGQGLVQVISGHRPASELGGPIKIAQISGQAAALGVDQPDPVRGFHLD